MNVFISTVLFLTYGVSCISSVVLEGFFEVEDGDVDEMISRIDTKAILNNLEHETFQEVSHLKRRTYNAKKCCKVGKKVAEESLFCNIDMMQVEKKNNGAHRRKMKFHGPLAQTENAQNDLMEKVEKCYPSKASRSMFTKCCQWQQSLIDELESCKDLESKEAKRDCRRDVKSRERRRKK